MQAALKPFIVFRVQDLDGRGPWKPGFSKYWIEHESNAPQPADIVKAFGVDVLRNLSPRGHYGCGVRQLEQLRLWFTPVERARLANMGYEVVSLMADVVVAENSEQVVFGRNRPLNKGAIVINWSLL